MKKIILSLLTVGIMAACSEKTSVVPQAEISTDRSARTLPGIDGVIFTSVEQNPEFPGGVAAMYDYIGQNLKYPKEAQESKTTGKVFLKFVVDKEGKVRQITTLKGIGSGCDEEAARVLAAMPTWTPGKQDGKPVNVYFTMPISFKLDSPASPSATSTENLNTSGFSAISDKLGKEGIPLILIDGVEAKKETLDLVTPNRIEKMDVLKGEAATKAHGEKGKYGVILITTKK